MARFAALLRGINVGGKHKIKMAELRESLTSTGLDQVVTYIQSGNIVFSSAEKELKLELLIRDVIHEKWGFDIQVLVRSAKDIQSLIRKNPFSIHDAKHLVGILLRDRPGKKMVTSIPDVRRGDEDFAVVGKTVYLYCPHGIARSKLTIGLFEKHLQTSATARNWNTLNKLAELLG